MNQEEIDARIALSKKKYQARKAEQIEKINIRKAGIKFINENNIKIYNSHIGMSDLTIGFWREDGIYLVAYTVKSKKDKFSVKKAKGLIGNRLSSADTRTKEGMVTYIERPKKLSSDSDFGLYCINKICQMAIENPEATNSYTLTREVQNFYSDSLYCLILTEI